MRRKTPRPIKSKALLSVLRGIVDGTRTTIKLTQKTVKTVKRVNQSIKKAKIKGISKPRRNKK